MNDGIKTYHSDRERIVELFSTDADERRRQQQHNQRVVELW